MDGLDLGEVGSLLDIHLFIHSIKPILKVNKAKGGWGVTTGMLFPEIQTSYDDQIALMDSIKLYCCIRTPPL